MTKALVGLAPFWPHIVIPKIEGHEDAEVGGIAMYRDLEGAIRLRAALDELIKEQTS